MPSLIVTELEAEKAACQRLVDERADYSANPQINVLANLVRASQRALKPLADLQDLIQQTTGTDKTYVDEMMDDLAAAIGEAEVVLRK